MLTEAPLFYIDQLSVVMMSLISFVALCIGSFTSRYFKGDRQYFVFYGYLCTLVACVFVMVNANHLLLLLIGWILSNYCLTCLMLHKKQWRAAKESATLARRNFGLGSALLGASCLLLYISTGEATVQGILVNLPDTPWIIGSSALIILAAMTQSSLWPFHRWLLSSLNSPTPVSALMHAGLINGGGFLLARFAPLIAAEPVMLNIVFVAGIATALVGTLWKLMQSDVKRMLACSTMGQMGFMIAQCGLGLFPAAVAHLCWHGLFKAYLFLASGAAAQDSRLDLDYPPPFKQFAMSLLCGMAGAFVFSLTGSKPLMTLDTSLFLVAIAMIAGTQFALTILRRAAGGRLAVALAATAAMGYFYGTSVHLVESLLAPINMFHAQPLNSLHIIALIALAAAWLAMIFARALGTEKPDWMLRAYVRLFNASQPHPSTITAHRNYYQY